LLAAATSLRQAIGEPLPPVAREEQQEMLVDLRVGLGEGAFAAAWEAGRDLAPEEAIDEAIREVALGAAR